MKAITAGIISVITWGTVFVFGKFAVKKGCHPVLLSFIRFFSASIFLFLYLSFKRVKLKIEKRDIFSLVVLGLTGIFGMNIFIFYSLKFTTSTSSSILMNSNSFFIGIFAYMFLKEKVKVNEIIGILVGFLGCYFMITQGKFSFDVSFTGNLLALLASLSWAFYTVWSKKSGVIKKYGAILSTFWASTFGTFFLFLTLIALHISFHPGKAGLITGIYLGIIPAGIGFTLWFYAINKIKTFVAGILQFIAPLTTGIIAILWFKEKISVFTYLGGIFIILGVIISTRKTSLERN